MKLRKPFMISARLLPAVRVADATISLKAFMRPNDVRMRYRYFIDFDNGQHYQAADLSAGMGSVDDAKGYQAAFGSLLGFMSACAESRAYAGRNGRAGENADLFPPKIGAWIEAHADEITMLGIEIEESAEALLTD